MARPNKQGLDYFPLDTNFFLDLKVRKIKKTCGPQSIAVLLHILCTIYRNGYYVAWPDGSNFFVAEDVDVDEELVDRVLSRCFQVDFLSEEMYRRHGVLTSRGIQLRYQNVCSKCRRLCLITDYNLISSEETAVSSEENPIPSEQTPDNSEERRDNDNTLRNKAYSLGVNQSEAQTAEKSDSIPGVSSEETKPDSAVSSEETPISSELTRSKPPVSSELTPPYKRKENISSSYSPLQGSTTTRFSDSLKKGKGNEGNPGAKFLEDELRAKGVDEEHLAELKRLTCNFDASHVGTNALLRWIGDAGANPYYYVLQQLQRMENEGRIPVSVPRDIFHVTRYLEAHLKPSDYQAAVSLIRTDSHAFAECKGLIKDCQSGKIKSPGGFIMSKLHAYRQSQNQNISV
jgi:hypothetical protein